MLPYHDSGIVPPPPPPPPARCVESQLSTVEKFKLQGDAQLPPRKESEAQPRHESSLAPPDSKIERSQIPPTPLATASKRSQSSLAKVRLIFVYIEN